MADSRGRGAIPFHSITFVVFFALIVAGFNATYWIYNYILHPYEDFSTSVLYRMWEGDKEYLSLIFNLAKLNFTEWFCLDCPDGGVVSFPLLALAPYSLFVSIFGPMGMVVGDIVVGLARFVAICLLVRIIFRVKPLSLFIISFSFWLLSWETFSTSAFPWLADFVGSLWSFRIPRTGVSSIGFLLLSCTSISLWRDCRSKNVLLAHCFLLGIMAQLNLYSAVAFFLFSTIFLASKLLDRTLSPLEFVWPVLLLCLAFSPFLIQVIQSSPDLRVRWGEYPVIRNLPMFILTESQQNTVPLAVVSLGFILWRKFKKRAVHPQPVFDSSCIECAALLCFASYFSLVIFTLLTEKALQEYHFFFESQRFHCVLVACWVGAVWGAVRSKIETGLGTRGLAWAQNIGLLALSVVGVFLFVQALAVAKAPANRETQISVYASKGWEAIPEYRNNFDLLAKELSKEKYRQVQVLGTYDYQVEVWWLCFANGNIYIPDPSMSSVRTATIEQRMLEFFVEIGATPQDFEALIEKPYVQYRLYNYFMNRVFRRHVPCSLDEYSPDQWHELLEILLGIRGRTNVVPAKQKAALMRRFAQKPSLSKRLDALVLTRSQDFSFARVDENRFVKSYENEVFSLFVKKGLLN